MSAVVHRLEPRAMAVRHRFVPVRDSAPHAGFPLGAHGLEVS
jgi:hypothetical protein